MSDLGNRSQSSARRSDYVWQYEYYDDEEPVSFEGLRAHRYSIVIGFWVGLAVFVIFMFFVLTLLTKTGAPHPENPDAGKRHEAESCLVNISGGQDEALSRPFLPESHSYFNFYSREADEGKGEKKTEDDSAGRQSGVQQLGRYKRAGGRCTAATEEVEEAEGGVGAHSPLSRLTEGRDSSSLSHFNIPNFVSSLGEDELLCGPCDIRERQQDPLDFYHR